MNGIDPLTVRLGLYALGSILALFTIAIAIKSKFEFKGETIISAVGTIITILSGGAIGKWANFTNIQLTPSEAAVVTVLGYWATVMIVVVFVPSCVVICVLCRLAIRSGPRCAGLACNHLILGKERVAAWEEFRFRFEANPTWDQFALAVSATRSEIRIASFTYQLLQKANELAANGDPELTEHQAAEQARSLLDKTLGPILKNFNAETDRSAWRFSIWRVSEDKEAAHRIWVTSDHPDHEPLPIWNRQVSPMRPATLAAKAMIERRSLYLTPTSPEYKSFRPGRLGVEYIALHVTPLICKEDSGAWGVLCIDLLHGTIPIDSRSVDALARELAHTLQPLGPILKKATLTGGAK